MNNKNTETETRSTNTNHTLPKLIEAGALFKKVSTKGTPYLFIKMMIPDQLGTPQAHLFRAFSNKYKTPENNVPDWIIYFADDNTVRPKPVTKAIKSAPISLPQEATTDENDTDL